ncbi:MAG: hypothetical protein QM723_07115 [Myxococcaceae bacterium]
MENQNSAPAVENCCRHCGPCDAENNCCTHEPGGEAWCCIAAAAVAEAALKERRELEQSMNRADLLTKKQRNAVGNVLVLIDELRTMVVKQLRPAFNRDVVSELRVQAVTADLATIEDEIAALLPGSDRPVRLSTREELQAQVEITMTALENMRRGFRKLGDERDLLVTAVAVASDLIDEKQPGKAQRELDRAAYEVSR